MKYSTLILFLLASLSFQSAHADAKYPKSIPLRFFGSNQDVGSCQSEAMITAFEHKLAENGIYQRISLHHAHAWTWRTNNDAEKKDVGLVFTPNTLNIVNKYGAIVPDYFLPEDQEGIDMGSISQFSRQRPAIDTMGIYSPNYPAPNLAFSENYYSYKPNYSNSSNVDAMIAAVKSGQVVTIAIDADIFRYFSASSGFLNESFAGKVAFKEINHAVAVVGWDDDLGGLIIRNTWNSPGAIRTAAEAQSIPELQNDLKKFKLKIADAPLPGYYLIPYQMIRDGASQGLGGFRIYRMDLNAFANFYEQMKTNYSVVKSVYSCQRDQLAMKIDRFAKALEVYESSNSSEEKKAQAFKQIKSIIYDQVTRSRKTFAYAKQSRLNDGSIDHVRDFYNGAFIGYYCDSPYLSDPQAGFWPRLGKDTILNNPMFSAYLRKISTNYSDLTTWFEFFKLVSKKEYRDELKK
jgi:hypothetical protein